MIKRCLCLVCAVLVCASSVFAWDEESFIGDMDLDEDAASGVVTYSADGDSDLGTSVGCVDFIRLLSLSPDTAAMGIWANYYIPLQYISGVKVGGYAIDVGFPDPFVDMAVKYGDSASRSYIMCNAYDVTLDAAWNDWELQYVVSSLYSSSGSRDSELPSPCVFDVDLSPFGTFYAFSLSGSAIFSYKLFSQGTVYGGTLDLYVNGALVHTFSQTTTGYFRDFQFSDFVYNSTVPITSLQFCCHPREYKFSVSTTQSGDLSTVFYLDKTFNFSILTPNAVLDGYNDQAQDSINDHNAVESEWTGSMTENFNKLDISSFSFPSGLVSGFGLITGIFNDLWNAMGDYKILYVFPLTLGVVLLLIGRISKFAGRSSTKSDRGDGSA